MRIVAYLYSDPLLEATPDRTLWGWEVDRIYQDLAVDRSGSEKPGRGRSDRPQLQQCLQDCQIEAVDYLLVRRLEELGDSLTEIRDRLSHLERLEIRLIVVEQSELALASLTLAGNPIQSDLLQLLQQLQQNQRSRRIRQGHARNRLKAVPPPGKAPYGYRRSKNRYVIDRATAPVVKEFFEQFLLYGSVRGAVRYLEKKYSKKISVSTGHRWLTNPVYRGDLAYQNGEIISDTHPAIVSRDESAQVDRLLRRNRRLPPRTASAPRSLAGLVTCAQCQSSMTVTRVTTARSSRRASPPSEYLYLRPTACPQRPKCRATPYQEVLEAVIQRICEDLPRAVAGLSLPDLDRIKAGIGAAIAAKQAILAQLPGLISSGILDQETADLRAYKLQTELATLQDQLAQLPPTNLATIVQTVSLPQFWLDLSETERRFYFREFIRRIELVRTGETGQLQLIFLFTPEPPTSNG